VLCLDGVGSADEHHCRAWDNTLPPARPLYRDLALYLDGVSLVVLHGESPAEDNDDLGGQEGHGTRTVESQEETAHSPGSGRCQSRSHANAERRSGWFAATAQG
jgi:hypothetical protein